jgi:hypothetical protein
MDFFQFVCSTSMDPQIVASTGFDRSGQLAHRLAGTTKAAHSFAHYPGCPGNSKMLWEETSMSKHDEARRAFLKGAAIGAGAVAGAGLVPEAFAQTHEQHNDSPATTAQAHPHGPGHGAFLNVEG